MKAVLAVRYIVRYSTHVDLLLRKGLGHSSYTNDKDTTGSLNGKTPLFNKIEYLLHQCEHI